MGTNIHAFAHRLTAISMACLASAGFIFCALSGFGCSFIQIQALKGRSIGNVFGDVYDDVETIYLGVQCLSGGDAPFYDVDGIVDRLWNLSRIFLNIGLALGGTTTLFAWLLSSCIRPTVSRWRILSILAACSAVFQIPIFLVFESDNCNFDITRQTCRLSTSAYLNVVSISIWIVMTIWVQCLSAPRWDEELDAWRVSGNRGSSSSSPSEARKGVRRQMAQSKRSKEIYAGAGDETVETTEVAFSPPRTRKQSISSPSPLGGSAGNKDIEKQLDGQHKGHQQFDGPIEVTEVQFSVGASKAAFSKMIQQNDNNNRSSYNVAKWGRKRSKESSSISNTSKKQDFLRSEESMVNDIISYDKRDKVIDGENKDVGKNTAFSLMKSVKNNIPRVQISKSPTTTQAYTETIDSSRHNTAATVDKSVAVNTEKASVNQSQNDDITTTSSEKNRTSPGFHISCVYTDGTRQEVHFPSLPNCCIGMENTEEDEETKFQTFPQVSDDFPTVGFDHSANYNNKNSDSTDFLVRQLRKEEEAAAARRAKRNMAPVASFEFVTSKSLVKSNRRKNRNVGHRDVVINDDVSEMTRGSGWASGVSEILDDTDVRHQL